MVTNGVPVPSRRSSGRARSGGRALSGRSSLEGDPCHRADARPSRRRLVALAETLAERLRHPRGRPRPRRRATRSRASPRSSDSGYFAAADARASTAASASRRCTTCVVAVEPARARRRLGRDRRQHAPGRRCSTSLRRWQMARPPATSAAPRRSARRSRRSPRRHRDRHGGQRAGGRTSRGPTTTRDAHAGRAGAIDGRKVFCTMSPAATRPLHGGHLRRRRRPRALRLRARPRGERPAWSSTTTGTRSACAPRAATR